jgi:hypothetical protein
MIFSGTVDDETEAVALGAALMEANLLYCAVGACRGAGSERRLVSNVMGAGHQPFRNSRSMLYRFVDDGTAHSCTPRPACDSCACAHATVDGNAEDDVCVLQPGDALGERSCRCGNRHDPLGVRKEYRAQRGVASPQHGHHQ